MIVGPSTIQYQFAKFIFMIKTTTMGAMPTRPIHEIRRSNLLLLVKEAGSPGELSKRTGISEPQLSHRKNGVRNIGPMHASKLEEGMGKPRGWMDEDHSSGNEGRLEASGARIKAVPLIQWAQAWRAARDMLESSESADAPVVYADASIGEGAFALRVRGDSMVDTTGTLSFPDGCIIVVDPDVNALPGDQVVVQLKTAEEAAFKTLEYDGQQYFLKPLNPRYPITPMPGDAKIIGVVVSVTTAIQPRSRKS